MYVLVKPNGGMYWRLDYRFHGKRKTLALGVYPDVTLKMARDRREAARRRIADGIDPSLERKASKKAKAETFQAVAEEWFKSRKPNWAESHATKNWSRLRRLALPYLGTYPVAEITAPLVLEVLRKVENSGTGETAHRLKSLIGQVMRYAVATGRAQNDPTGSLKGALKAVKEHHLPAETNPDKVAKLLRIIEGYAGEPTVAIALKVAPYVFVRPGELRAMRWNDLDFNAKEWRYTVRKTSTPHLVPLSDQVIALIEELRPLTGKSAYVFRSSRGERPISDMTLTAALRRLGIDTANEHTVHGWRATARTLLHEQLRYAPDWIERQLAHVVLDRLGEAYARAQFIDDRRKMMQHYANYLDGLKSGNVA